MNSQKVVIVGGGTAGISAAARLRRQAPSLSIQLIEPSQRHFYQPLWTLVGGGVVKKEKTSRPTSSLIPEGVEWICESATEIDPTQKTVRTTNRLLNYDYLIVTAGLKTIWNGVKGLPEAIGKEGVCSNYSYDYVDQTWEFIRDFKGGTAVFTFPNTPVKCAGAPQKIMYLADEAFRRSGVRERTKIIYISPAAEIFAVSKYARELQRIVERKKIETLFGHHVVEILPKAKKIVVENIKTKERSEINYDFAHITPPMGAPDFIKTSKLANAAGWVDVDQKTLQHVRFPNVFSAGDVSSLPTSKTGAAIRKQVPILVDNLLSTLRGEMPKKHYDGYTSCPLVTGYGKLILAEFDYDKNPRETFPFDQSKERYSMYLLKKHGLPKLYWHGMMKGRA